MGSRKNLVMAAVDLAQLLKMLIEADLYDRLQGNIAWRMVLSPRMGTLHLPLCEVGYLLAKCAVSAGRDYLRHSYEMREELIRNVGEMLAHPIDAFGKLSDQFKANYTASWVRFLELKKQTDLKCQFEAGEIFGDVLMEAVMLVLTVVSVAGAAAKLAAKVPQLARLANLIKGARAAEAGGVAEEAAEAAKMADRAKSATRTAEAAPKGNAEVPKAKPLALKTPVAGELFKIDANGAKAVQIRQGTNGKVAVIGRDMNTVRPYAAELKSKGYDVEIFDGDTVPDAARSEWAKIKKSGKWLTEDEIPQTETFKANAAWADKLVSENYTVVDLGSPAGTGSSQFYNLELSIIF